MPSEKFHDCQLKVPFIDFQSILKSVYEQHREKINRMKTERIGERLYAEKVTQVTSGWCMHSTFAYGDVLDSLKMYRAKDFVEKFIQHIEE